MKFFDHHLLNVFVPLLLIFASCGKSDKQSQSETMENSSTQQHTMSQAGPSEKLNLNTASGDDFRTIPGVGDRMVHEFEEYRPYSSIQQFRQEIGKYVDEDQVAAYEQYVFVPIAPNDCDAATLQQIPGLEASQAEELINARPFESNEAFLQQLSEYVNEDQLSTAKRFLASE